jgi:hypothetical protein
MGGTSLPSDYPVNSANTIVIEVVREKVQDGLVSPLSPENCIEHLSQLEKP